jgi:hypothetical protein
MIMRNQGFIHPATLVPDELEYNKGYEARMSKLNEKFKDLEKLEKVAPKLTSSKTSSRKGGRAILQEQKHYVSDSSSANQNTKSSSHLQSKSPTKKNKSSQRS